MKLIKGGNGERGTGKRGYTAILAPMHCTPHRSATRYDTDRFPVPSLQGIRA